MAKRRSKKTAGGYFGLGWVISLILCFFFGWFLACIHRFARGKILLGVLAIPIIFGLFFWIVDFICLIAKKDIVWLA